MNIYHQFRALLISLVMIASQTIFLIPPTLAQENSDKLLPIENFKCQNPFLHGELQQKEFNLVYIINQINRQYQNNLTDWNKLNTEVKAYSDQIDEIADMATWLVSNRGKLKKFLEDGRIVISTSIDLLDALPIESNLHVSAFTGEESTRVSLSLKDTYNYLQDALEKVAGIDTVLETLKPSTLADFFGGFSSTFSEVADNSGYMVVNLSDNLSKQLRAIRSQCENLSSGMNPNVMIRVATVDIAPNPNCLYGYSLGGYFYDLQNGQTRRSRYSARDKYPTNCGFYFGEKKINIVAVKTLDNFTYQTLYQMNNSLHSLTMYNYIIYKYERLENNQCSEVSIAKSWQMTDSDIGSQTYSLTVGNWSMGWSSPVVCSGASCTLNKIKSIPLPQVNQYSTITECPAGMN